MSDSEGWSTDEGVWAACFLIFLFFFLFQAVFPVQGYMPFHESVWVAYAQRTLLSTFLFFGLLIWVVASLGEGGGRYVGNLALGLVLVAFTLYFTIIVSNRPELTPINDRSEALSLALTDLFQGRFPYLQVTHLSGPITPLTTSLLIALPAQLLFGRPELMTAPMLGVAFLALLAHRRQTGSRFPISLLALLLFLNPIVVWEECWGSDLLWGPVLLIIATTLLDRRRIQTAAVVFGLALCTRPAFFVLTPMWLGYVLRHQHRALWRFALITGAVVLALELPLILWNPGHFFQQAPLGQASQKLILPWPEGDNAISDALLTLPLSGMVRQWVLSALVLILSALLGLRCSNVSQLCLCTAALFAFMLFLMGPFFLLDYLVWIALPLLQALIGHSIPIHPDEGVTE